MFDEVWRHSQIPPPLQTMLIVERAGLTRSSYSIRNHAVNTRHLLRSQEYWEISHKPRSDHRELWWWGDGWLGTRKTDHCLSIRFLIFTSILVRFHVGSAIKETSWELQQGNFNNLLISWYAFTEIVSSVFNECLSTLSRTFVIRQWYLMITLIYTNNY